MKMSESKRLSLPEFNGDGTKYQLWKTKLMAYAGVYGFVAALREGGESTMPVSEVTVLDLSKTSDKAANEAKKRNAIAMANLTMAMSTEEAMSVVYESYSNEWPGGLAHVVMSELEKKYAPKDTITRVELKKMLHQITMKDGDNPQTLFEQIATIKNKYNDPKNKIQIDEADLIAQVLIAAPRSYQQVLTAEELRLGDAMKLSDLSQAMTTHYRATNNNLDDGGREFSLAGVPGTGGPICFICGERGHKAFQCPKRIKRNNGNNRGGNNNGKQQRRFTGTCNLCGKVGHKAADCWENEKNKDKRPPGWKSSLNRTTEVANATIETESSGVEFLLTNLDKLAMQFPNVMKILLDPNVFVADTGSSSHSSPHGQGLKNLKAVEEGTGVIVGNGAHEMTKQKGDLDVDICDKHGTKLSTATLTDVNLVPTNKFNLFSLTKMQKQGWMLGGDSKSISLTKGGKKIVFDIVIDTPDGMICCIYLNRHTTGTELAGMATKMNINKAHELLGHSHEKAVRESAKALGWELTRGTMNVCQSCAAGKAKQKNVPKDSEHHPATENGERVFLDIATVKKPQGTNLRVTKPNWRIIVDERTGLKFSDFYATKNGMVEPTCEQFNRWKQANKPVKHVRCDNAGENKLLQQRCNSKDWKLDIDFEYTARNTPQQNHLAELGFAVIANRGRAMMHRANIPLRQRYKLYPEAFKTATLLDGLGVIDIDGVNETRYVHFSEKNPKFSKHLRTWGEAGTVTLKSKATPKIADRGMHCMFIGYATDHDGDCYRMWNPKTNRVHETRDVVWLRRMFYEKVEGAQLPSPPLEPMEVITENDNEIDVVNDEPDDNNEEPEQPEEVEQIDDDEDELEIDIEETEPMQTRSATQQARSFTRSGIQYSEELGTTVIFDDEEIEELNLLSELRNIEFGCVGAGLGGGFTDTHELHVMNYDEAMNTPDKDKWEDAVVEEHDRMMKHVVFEPVLKSELPEDTNVIDSTWAMKKKASGKYRARLAARGFKQKDGVDYDGHSLAAPVTTDITIRIILTIMLMASWYAHMLDVKGAFLHGTFDNGEKVHMDVPQGFERWYDPRLYVLLLLQTLYGTKQAAMAFWRKLLQCFRSMGYERSKIDPCLYFKWTAMGLVLWLSWVDDCLCVGPKDEVMKAKQQMMDRFDCDDVGELKEYIGCKVDINKEEGSIKLTQPVMLQSFKDEFDLVDGYKPNIPMEAGKVLKAEEEHPLKKEEQSTFRSGIGKLLHMMRWSRPDILNATRELSKCMGSANKDHLKRMKQTMSYCVNTEDRGLFLKPKNKWDGDPNYEFNVKGKADANYGTDTTKRHSTSGTITYLEEAPVAIRSKQQDGTTLSVTEAELVAATSCAQDMLFTMRLIESLGLKVKKPMKLFVDNKGAVDLANNWSIGGRTRHMDIRQHFLREMKEKGVILTRWISSNEQEADVLTKNLPKKEFEWCIGHLVAPVQTD